MFKLFVVVMLCVIALHACADDTVVYAVHLPYDVNYLAITHDDKLTTIDLPFALSEDMFLRIW